MARSEARILVDIWDDPDFVRLTGAQQREFFFLISQRDLAHDGTLALRERRWARSAAEHTAAQVTDNLAALENAGFIVVDEDTEELLIRSFIRRDKVYKQPNVLLAAHDHLPLIASKQIKLVLLGELERIADSGEEMSERSWEVLKQMIVALQDTVGEPHRNPLGEDGPIPTGNPSADPSRNPSANPSGEPFAAPEPNPSGNPSGGAPGERGVVTAVRSDSPSPSHLSPQPTATAAPSPTGADKPRGESRGESRDREGANPDVDRIVAHLAKRIVDNGYRKPRVTDAWRKEIRLLLADERPYKLDADTVIKGIDWAMSNGFYRRNVQSGKKLREHWDRLWDEAKEKRDGRRGNAGTRTTAAWNPQDPDTYFND